jgi:hypothetical protein
LKKPWGTAKSLDAVSKLLKAESTMGAMIETSNGEFGAIVRRLANARLACTGPHTRARKNSRC